MRSLQKICTQINERQPDRRPGSRPSRRWRLDAATSSAEFRVPHVWGLVTINGHFERLDGWLELDDNSLGRLELTNDSASLNTGNPKRDAHLRSADFFDTEHHPEARFRSTHLSNAATGASESTGSSRPPANAWP